MATESPIGINSDSDRDISTYSSSVHCQNPLRGAVEILPDQLYYCALDSPPNHSEILYLQNHHHKQVPVQFFTVDKELIYANFARDFGPLNLGQLYRFTVKLKNLLAEPYTNKKNKKNRHRHRRPILLFYSSTELDKRANAMYLICAWQVLELKRTPEQAFLAFQYYLDHKEDDDDPPTLSSFISRRRSHSRPPPTPLTDIGKDTVAALPPFHDASPMACTYKLTLMDCLEGLVKARQLNFLNWDAFNVDEYEFYEKIRNGDMNWIIPNKILAFAAPSFEKAETSEGNCICIALAPADYIPYFKSSNVGLVVRLNDKTYNEEDFVNAGIDHLEQFFPDGSCPSITMLKRVLEAMEAVPSNKAIALHCTAGLGRTGVCIGAYMMKHYRLTAANVISWMRICRPGMVIGQQQHFLADLEPVMWQEGEMLKVPKGFTFSTMRTWGKKRNCTATTADKEPAGKELLLSLEDVTTGQPGQAEALLASRRKRQHTTTTVVSACASSTSGDPTTEIQSSAEGPVLITPDSVAGTHSQGCFAEDKV